MLTGDTRHSSRWGVHASVTQMGRRAGPRADRRSPVHLSPRLARRALASVLCMSVGLVVGVPNAQASGPLGRDANYPLRHSFSMAVGLPGAGKHEPTSCYDRDGSREYVCRIVAGVEETRDRRDFYVTEHDV